MILRVKKLCKTYYRGDVETSALTDVTFDMEKGEYVSVLGPSGSGKSTLMNLIGGLERPTSGDIFFDGEDLSNLPDGDLADFRLDKVGFVFRDFQLLPQETVLENVALPLVYAGFSRAERLDRAEEILVKAGLENRMDCLPEELSGGQQQRAAIARAMIYEPDILLAYEPAGSLDSASGEQIMDLFDRIHQDGVSILMFTHEVDMACCADRVLELQDGRLKSDTAFSDETDFG